MQNWRRAPLAKGACGARPSLACGPGNLTLSSLVLGLAVVLGGCSGLEKIDRPPLGFTEARAPEGRDTFPNWPLPPPKLESFLAAEMDGGNFKLMESKKTEYGGSGPSRISLYFPSVDREIRFKWKVVPRNKLETVNNSPRKEIAAYQVQKLFMEPEDYVVPTTIALCVPLESYRMEEGEAKPSLPGASCVLGTLAVWLDEVTIGKDLYQAERFTKDPGYAYYMANFNLLTYLIDHKDSRESNFLVSKESNRRQVFSVDNGIAFQPFLYKFFADNWDVIRVAGLRREQVERLRALKREDLDALGVVGHFEKDERGVFVAGKAKRNLGPNKGVRVGDDKVQIGLARFEIDGVWDRMQALLQQVDSGEIPVF